MEGMVVFDAGTCVRVAGVLLRDYIANKEISAARERESAKAKRVEPSCAMVANKIAVFEQDGVRSIGSRIAAQTEHGACYRRHTGEWSCVGNRPLKERRRLARSRRNQQAREKAFRVVEAPALDDWRDIVDDHLIILALVELDLTTEDDRAVTVMLEENERRWDTDTSSDDDTLDEALRSLNDDLDHAEKAWAQKGREFADMFDEMIGEFSHRAARGEPVASDDDLATA